LTDSAPRWFFIALAAALAVRLFFAAVVPITGDEAYFFYWGLAPDYGYYDHPPMAGWFAWVTQRFGEAEWVLRLPAVLLLAPVAGITVALAWPAGEARAWLAGLAVMLVPVEFLNIAFTTDTPLVLFVVASVLAYAKALDGNRSAWYVAAGALLGLALLSKYFAVLLAIAYFVFAVTSPRAERRLSGFAIVVLSAVPFFAVNLLWNYWHCWANVLFNLLNRHEGAGLGARSWETVAAYVASVLYMLSAVAIVQLSRTRGWARAMWANPRARLALVTCAVPFALFAVLSPFRTVGLHWFFAFVPSFYVAIAFALTPRQLRLNVFVLAAATALHLAAIAVAGVLPLETWQRLRIYDGLVMTVKSDEVLDRLKAFTPEFALATEGYSPSVTLSYNARRQWGAGAVRASGGAVPAALEPYMIVFGRGALRARHDDILTDVARLDAGNILVFRKTPADPADYEPYFERVEYREFEVRGAKYYLVLGRGFRFAPYRDTVLVDIRNRWYRVPSWVPQGECYLCSRYFGQPTCPAR